MRAVLLIATAVLTVFVPLTAAAAPNQAQMGDKVSLGQGQIWTFVTTDASGQPDTVGIEFTEGALSGLPAEMAQLVLTLPAGVPLPFDHAMVDWNPQGHEPPGVYTLPHFDFHFYMVPKEQVMAISPGSCSTADNAAVPNPPGVAPVPCDIFGKAMASPITDMMPDGYSVVPAVVPMMGNHLMDMSSPEFNGQEFNHTFIWGLYDGQITFMEPMITKAFLESHQDVTQPLKTPKAMPKAGLYPTEMQIRYNADSKTHVVALADFKEFPAASAVASK